MGVGDDWTGGGLLGPGIELELPHPVAIAPATRVTAMKRMTTVSLALTAHLHDSLHRMPLRWPNYAYPG